ncbi:MAG: DUF4493 domain-containing protein, partial [Muribaculaceae bacterium]|nr:DUF4493 domain-containing protein [Muribaculaceae bacterium]
DVSLDDFTVVFTRNGVPEAKYRYSDMPEVVTLPVGEYVCSATYGENRVAEWESPYYLGRSAAFEVEPYEITSYIDPIECKLENVKVTVTFDPGLVSRMSSDSYVEVKVGANEGLAFTNAEAASGKAGYFLHTAETTLVATFYGAIDGVEATETKSYRDIQRGYHYKLNFKLHEGPGGNDTGDIEGEVLIDGSVTVVDVDRDVEIEDDLVDVDDSEHPNQGGDKPNPPGPGPEPQAPTITGVPPVDIDGVNDGNTLPSCVIKVHSDADGGITGFDCDIVSEKLTPEDLDGVGLSSHLDIANTPAELEGALTVLGLPVNVAGQKDVEFDISGFLVLMGGLGECEHHFVLTVTDANCTTVKTLKIKF